MSEHHREQLTTAAKLGLAAAIGGYGVKLVRDKDLVGYFQTHTKGFSFDVLKDGRKKVVRLSGDILGFGKDGSPIIELDDRKYSDRDVAEVQRVLTGEPKDKD